VIFPDLQTRYNCLLQGKARIKVLSLNSSLIRAIIIAFCFSLLNFDVYYVKQTTKAAINFRLHMYIAFHRVVVAKTLSNFLTKIRSHNAKISSHNWIWDVGFPHVFIIAGRPLLEISEQT